MKSTLVIILMFVTYNAFASMQGDCAGTPKEAVTELPAPFDKWGQIVCTPYGHIISNKEGWIWSNPGGYRPVMIPSQMVRSNPKAVGNESYFSEISLKQLIGEEAESAVEIFEQGFDKSPKAPKVYSVKVVSISGKELGFQFFEFEKHSWGMWCNKECDPGSRFMILNMEKEPNNGN